MKIEGIVGIQDEAFKEVMNKLETKLDRSIHVKDCLEGDQLLDNQDLCLLLGVTKRTLRRYR